MMIKQLSLELAIESHTHTQTWLLSFTLLILRPSDFSFSFFFLREKERFYITFAKTAGVKSPSRAIVSCKGKCARAWAKQLPTRRIKEH